MSVIALTSASGAPGVTTAAVALAHHLGMQSNTRTLLLEADSDGGVLASRYTLPLAPGLTELAGASRASTAITDLQRYHQPLTAHVDAVLAHPSAEQTGAALRTASGSLPGALRAVTPGHVIIDAGRARPGSQAVAFLGAADLVLLVVRPTAEAVITAMNRLEFLERGSAAVALLLVGDQPYGAAEVAHACGAAVVATVPYDVTAATRDPLADARRGSWRKAWLRAAVDVAAAAERANATFTPITHLRPTEASA